MAVAAAAGMAVAAAGMAVAAAGMAAVGAGMAGLVVFTAGFTVGAVAGMAVDSMVGSMVAWPTWVMGGVAMH
jgi:hypothetical protein